jgi:3-oxoacyl-[acyl-carrier protein] reductase
VNLGLKDKIALVTGGSYGIGRAIALALASEGCRVAICARGRERLDRTASEIRSGGAECLPIVADALVHEDIRRTVTEVVDRWKRLDILVNNVGGGRVFPGTPVEQIPASEWVESYERNAFAAVRFTMEAVPHMRRAAWGRVVAIASIKGREGGGMPWYTMSKSAEIAFMKSMALNAELVRDGITFNSIAPGRVLFEGNGWDQFRSEDPERYQKSVDRVPLGRPGTPEEVAAVVAFVCSEPARLVNGACIAVDGGESFSF